MLNCMKDAESHNAKTFAKMHAEMHAKMHAEMHVQFRASLFSYFLFFTEDARQELIYRLPQEASLNQDGHTQAKKGMHVKLHEECGIAQREDFR